MSDTLYVVNTYGDEFQWNFIGSILLHHLLCQIKTIRSLLAYFVILFINAIIFEFSKPVNYAATVFSSNKNHFVERRHNGTTKCESRILFFTKTLLQLRNKKWTKEKTREIIYWMCFELMTKPNKWKQFFHSFCTIGWHNQAIGFNAQYLHTVQRHSVHNKSSTVLCTLTYQTYVSLCKLSPL